MKVSASVKAKPAARVRADKTRAASPEEMEAMRRMLAEACFHDFVAQAWHVVEPETPFVGNWHIKALCEHVEAVTDKLIMQLLVNVPPGTMKSLLVCVFWPAWVWATRPGRRFMFSSYSETLSIRDSVKTRKLVQSEWYQSRWGIAAVEDRNQGRAAAARESGFELVKEMDTRLETTAGGWRIVGSITGKGIGEHPDYNCLHPEAKVITSTHGEITIKRLVEERLRTDTWSWNHEEGRPEWRRVASFSKTPGRPCVAIRTARGSRLVCTLNHPIFVVGKGYIDASTVVAGDEVISSREIERDFVVAVEDAGKPGFVYNVEVEGNHNYFADGMLTHNCADDPHNVIQAESDAERQTVTRWFEGVFCIRGEVRNVARVLVMQRLHAQDCSGVAMGKGGWTHLCLPMRFEPPDEIKKEVDGVQKTVEWRPRMPVTPLGFQDPRREPGELLWPAIYHEAKVSNIEVNLGTYAASGQLQQRPSPRGGGTFKRAWFGLPLQALPPKVSRKVRYWDKAGTAGGTGAETATVLMFEFLCPDEPLPAMRRKYLVVDAECWRVQAAEREMIIKQKAAADKAKWGYVETWVEQEPGSGGKESADGTVANNPGYTFKVERVTGSKEVRCGPLAAQASVGKVFLMQGDWNEKFLGELEMFPVGKLKDLVDAGGGAFNKLTAATGAFDNESLKGSAAVGGGPSEAGEDPPDIDLSDAF